MHNVAIVFDPDYSSSLEKLAFHTPVWLIDTPANRAAAEDVWRASVDWPHMTVTLFRPPANHVTKREWSALLAEIAIRERTVEAVDAIGAPLTLMARAALVDAGYARFDETATGFKAKKF